MAFVRHFLSTVQLPLKTSAFDLSNSKQIFDEQNKWTENKNIASIHTETFQSSSKRNLFWRLGTMQLVVKKGFEILNLNEIDNNY